MAFRWRADDASTLNACLVVLWFFQGIRTSIAKKPYIYVIFQGGGADPLRTCTWKANTTIIDQTDPKGV